jgi:hypothetical protein
MLDINFRAILIAITIIFITGCAAPPTAKIAAQHGFNKTFIESQPFSIASYQKILQPGSNVNIYIEGDGNAWISRYRISSDPSPKCGTTMQLASLDPSPNVVYLARPCQYSPQDLKTVCDSKYWSLARYSDLVVNSINIAVTAIKTQCQAPAINLIGYSGGGALAVLVANRRNDVASIRTVAGNLDLVAMEQIHDTTPLSESLDPLAVAKAIKHIPQLHFVGSRDHIVPIEIAYNFVHAAELDDKTVVIVKDATHNKNWSQHWSKLLLIEQ